MPRERKISARKGDKEISIRQRESDCPFLPVADLKSLHSFMPDKVDSFFIQLENNASHRLKQEDRLNTHYMRSTTLGQIFAFILGLSGIAGGVLIAIQSNVYIGGLLSVAIIFAIVASVVVSKIIK